ncbi:MAG: sulfotransferase family 2 domain-containing protein, partial [Isosphaeraceae bacterium]
KDPDLAIPDEVRRVLGRDDLRAVVGHFWFGVHRHIARPWHYITLLRHPIDRVLSLYYHVKTHYPNHSQPRRDQYRNRLVRPADIDGMSLEEFVEHPPFREVENDQVRRISGIEPALGGCTEHMLEEAKQNLRRHFAMVGVTERFDETLVLLKRKYGWTRDLLYYPRNTNPARPATETIPMATREAILRRNELDHELYRFAEKRLDEMASAAGPGFRNDLLDLQARREALLRPARAEASPEIPGSTRGHGGSETRREPLGQHRVTPSPTG